MKKMIALIAGMLLVPGMALAAEGIVGDCVDCHTMHNSQEGANVAQVYDPATGTYSTSEEPIQNLLRMDCIACHASPDATGKLLTLSGGSVVPQVSQPTDDNLAGGNFRYSTENQRHGHNVIDLTPADASNATQVEGGVSIFGAPPGNAHADHHDESSGVFTTTGGNAFDAFTCAGARGCHGTRSQALPSYTADWDANAATPNTWNQVRRTGIAAVSGAHHNNHDGYKPGTQYVGEQQHDGSVVADGYRFIPGLIGYGNDTATANRWQNIDSTSHNEYAGNPDIAQVGGCGDCHQEGTGPDAGGVSSRATSTSYLKVPGQSVSGFCATCHGVFHSVGTGSNGTSGAFLRHPSDWVIPESGEYAAYDTYDITAPVARPLTAFSAGMAPSATVTGDTDMVMCLSCHAAHATQYDYMLRFPYEGADIASATMEAGGYATVADAQAAGGCLACHTEKGVLPENR